jgi:hypothetical protein
MRCHVFWIHMLFNLKKFHKPHHFPVSPFVSALLCVWPSCFRTITLILSNLCSNMWKVLKHTLLSDIVMFNLLEWRNNTAPCRHFFDMFWLGVNQEYQGHFILWRDQDWSKICEQSRAERCAVSGGRASLLWTQDCPGDMVTPVPSNAQLKAVWWEPTHCSYQWHSLSHLSGKLGCSQTFYFVVVWGWYTGVMFRFSSHDVRWNWNTDMFLRWWWLWRSCGARNVE